MHEFLFARQKKDRIGWEGRIAFLLPVTSYNKITWNDEAFPEFYRILDKWMIALNLIDTWMVAWKLRCSNANDSPKTRHRFCLWKIQCSDEHPTAKWMCKIAQDMYKMGSVIIMSQSHWTIGATLMFMTTLLQTSSLQGEVAPSHYVLSSP